MPFWRRRESLHERLAREGGLLDAKSPHDTQPRFGVTGVHGVPRPREWDAVTGAEAPDLAGEELEFVALPDGTLLVDGEPSFGSLPSLERLSPHDSFVVRATRLDGNLWEVRVSPL